MVRDGLPGSLLPDSSQVCSCAMRLSTENKLQWLLGAALRRESKRVSCRETALRPLHLKTEVDCFWSGKPCFTPGTSCDLPWFYAVT